MMSLVKNVWWLLLVVMVAWDKVVFHISCSAS